MVCLSGTRVESRIVSPGHTKSGKIVKQSPVATLTQRRTTPFDVSTVESHNSKLNFVKNSFTITRFLLFSM